MRGTEPEVSLGTQASSAAATYCLDRNELPRTVFPGGCVPVPFVQPSGVPVKVPTMPSNEGWLLDFAFVCFVFHFGLCVF